MQTLRTIASKLLAFGWTAPVGVTRKHHTHLILVCPFSPPLFCPLSLGQPCPPNDLPDSHVMAADSSSAPLLTSGSTRAYWASLLRSLRLNCSPSHIPFLFLNFLYPWMTLKYTQLQVPESPRLCHLASLLSHTPSIIKHIVTQHCNTLCIRHLCIFIQSSAPANGPLQRLASLPSCQHLRVRWYLPFLLHYILQNLFSWYHSGQYESLCQTKGSLKVLCNSLLWD